MTLLSTDETIDDRALRDLCTAARDDDVGVDGFATRSVASVVGRGSRCSTAAMLSRWTTSSRN